MSKFEVVPDEFLLQLWGLLILVSYVEESGVELTGLKIHQEEWGSLGSDHLLALPDDLHQQGVHHLRVIGYWPTNHNQATQKC